MKLLKSILFSLLFVIRVTIAFGQIDVTVEVPKVVEMGENFRLQYNINAKPDSFLPPKIENFSIMAGPSTSTMSSVQIINGKRTETQHNSYTYILIPSIEGKFTIAAATFTVDGKNYYSKPVTIEVIKGGGKKEDGVAKVGGRDLFLKYTLSKNRVVVGEGLTLSIKLYTQVPITKFENVKFPSFDGFWSQELQAPTNLEFTRENVDGEIYEATLLRSYSLIPQKSGTLTIDGAEIVCQVRVRDESRKGRSLFDDFFDSYQSVRKSAVASTARVVVEPLPSGAPSTFSGGVGNFSISSKLSKDSVDVNEALYFIVEVSGKGNLNLLEIPKPNIPSSFEVYDPKISESKSGGVLTTKRFEYPLIARAPGEYKFEPLQFSYWDIGERKYKTINSSELLLKVSTHHIADSTLQQGAVTGVGKQSVKSIGEDIKFIVTAERLKKSGNLFFLFSPLYLSTLLLLIILYFILNRLMARKIARERDVAFMRNRKAKKVAKKRLAEAEQHLKADSYSLFYQSLYSALLGYISDKLNLNLSEISKDKIAEELSLKGVEAEMADSLLYLLDQCEYARYAPHQGEGEMEADYKRASKLIFSMEL